MYKNRHVRATTNQLFSRYSVTALSAHVTAPKELKGTKLMDHSLETNSSLTVDCVC